MSKANLVVFVWVLACRRLAGLATASTGLQGLEKGLKGAREGFRRA